MRNEGPGSEGDNRIYQKGAGDGKEGADQVDMAEGLPGRRDTVFRFRCRDLMAFEKFGKRYPAPKVPALQLIVERLPATVKLTAAVMIFVNLVSIPVGMIAAVRRYSLVDNVATFFALLGQAMPLRRCSARSDRPLSEEELNLRRGDCVEMEESGQLSF